MAARYFFTSDRLGWQRWREEDLALAQQLWGDPQVTAMIGGAMTPGQVVARLRHEIALQTRFGVQYWPVFWRESGEFVGCCGLCPFQDEIYELGFHLRPKFWGQGLAEEAGRAVIVYGFETLRAPALFAGHHPQNAGSRRVLQKLGFVYTQDVLYPPTGLMHPRYLLKAFDERG